MKIEYFIFCKMRGFPRILQKIKYSIKMNGI